ncbi:MAG: cysteine desulfurase family protein [Candidatus Enterosoma sp.]|nr:cysteine desulfurase [Bacilli bacterium]MDD7181676.1 cysteine desulfurase family protein [Bacilli bacterium]MDY3047268.1 cysteine desulfurase family protein [Candidatus Enterosoma sp.]
MKYNIYFDCASTVKPYPEVLKVFSDISMNDFANASSNHALGFQCSSILLRARTQVAKYLHVLPEEVIFTSGASEGNNLAIKGTAYHNKGWAKRIVTTKAEHPSVLNVFKKLEEEGFDVVYLDYDEEGKLDLEQLKEALKVPTSLVSVMSVNNEVGFIFPVDEIYSIVKKNSRAIVHVDATQSVTKENLNPSSYDLMTFSGHKIGGLKGSGVLVKKKNVVLDEQIIGGEQENGMRAGTTPLGLDCSIATALRLSMSTQNQRREQAKKINTYLREELSKIDEIEITSKGNCSPFMLSFALKLHKGSIIAESLSNMGVYVSTKSACSSREEGYSYVLKNAGYDEVIASNGIRLSFSGTEDMKDAVDFISALKEVLSSVKIKEN